MAFGNGDKDMIRKPIIVVVIKYSHTEAFGVSSEEISVSLFIYLFLSGNSYVIV